jgi:hypothetical protein
MTYGELKTYFGEMINRRDMTTTQRDRFITLGIQRVQRELRNIPGAETVSETTVDDTYDRGIDIPGNFLKVVNLSVDDAAPLRRVDLAYVQPFLLEPAGTPEVFARDLDKFILAPVPTEDSVIRLTYVADLAALEEDGDENWLTIIAPDIIVYAALVHAAAHFKSDRKDDWEAEYRKYKDELQLQALDDELANAAIMPTWNFQEDEP